MSGKRFWLIAIMVLDLVILLLLIGLVGPVDFAFFTLALLAGSFGAAIVASLTLKGVHQGWKSAYQDGGARWTPLLVLPFIVIAGAVSALYINAWVAGALAGAALIAWWLWRCKGVLYVIDQYRETFDRLMAGKFGLKK